MTDSPKHKPTAVRLTPERLKHADAGAQKEGISRHAYIVAAFDKGSGFKSKARSKKGPIPKSAKAALAHAEASAAHLAPKRKAPTVTEAVEVTRAYVPAKPRSRWDLSSVQVGPTVHKPGSMLKGQGKK